MFQSMRAQIEQDFMTFFVERGYQKQNEQALIPENDNSLRFTNAFICSFKERLQKRQVGPADAWVCGQNCLRLQNLESIRKMHKNARLHYASFFRMIGGLTGLQRQSEIAGLLCDFFIQFVGMRPERLFWKVSEETQHLVAKLPIGYQQFLSVKDKTFFDWSYGLPGIKGRGVTFCYLTDNGMQDFGNIVEIFDSHGALAVEFGFGIETLIARRYSLRNPLMASVISELKPAWESEDWDVLKDLILSIHALASCGVQPGKRGRPRIYRQSLKCMFREIDRLSIEMSDFLLLMRRLSKQSDAISDFYNSAFDELIQKEREHYESICTELQRKWG